MVFPWSLSDNKSSQASGTLLSILADLNLALVWIVSTCSLISESSSPFINHFVTVPRAPVTIGINVTFIFHSFFNSQTSSRNLSFFSLSFNFILWSPGTTKSTFLQVHFSLLIIIRSCRLAEIKVIRLYAKIPEEFVCVVLQNTDIGLCIYHLFLWSNLNFLHISQWISLPIQSYLVSYSFYANLLHSLIM